MPDAVRVVSRVVATSLGRVASLAALWGVGCAVPPVWATVSQAGQTAESSPASTGQISPWVVINPLDNAEGAEAVASAGVEASLATQADPAAGNGQALRVNIHFRSGAGYGGVRLKLPQPLKVGANYEFAFSVRSEGLGEQDLEFKLADPSGESVWWHNRRRFAFSPTWQRLTSKQRHIAFAWGPAAGAPLAEVGTIEFIAASVTGGSGALVFDDLRYRELPPSRPYAGTPVVSAGGNILPSPGDLAPVPSLVLTAGNTRPLRWGPVTQQKPAPARWRADFGELREFGGVRIRFAPGAGKTPATFTLMASEDNRQFSELATVRLNVPPAEHPGEFWLSLPDSQARTLELRPASDAGVELLEFEVLDVAIGLHPNAMLKAMAERAAAGRWPKAILGRTQSNWTVFGLSSPEAGDTAEGLINEEGQVEFVKRGPSVEPFIRDADGRLLTWADGTHTQSLTESSLPLPVVVRTHEEAGLTLKVEAQATGPINASCGMVRYTLSNTGSAAFTGELLLALRPVQVNPPWQWLNTQGGASSVRRLSYDPGTATFSVNGEPALRLVQPPSAVRVLAFADGQPTEAAAGSAGAAPMDVEDPAGLASGLARYAVQLVPGASASFVVVGPMHGAASAPVTATFEQALAEQTAFWRESLGRVAISATHPGAQRVIDTMRAQLAYILINRDNAGIQPGSRSYERSWIRDGSMTAAALLELGHTKEVERFIRWYAPYQFADGKVPCVVDWRGPDPVPEHDSHGQLIFAIANYHRFTGDRATAESLFTHVERAVAYIESLRAQRMTERYTGDGLSTPEPGKPPVPLRAFFGLVPESISHEGYSAKPMHSNWDTLFILRGLKDAVELAQALGRTEQAAKWATLRDEFRTTLYESMRLAMKAHGIDYLPGCVELGDFDATSTTIALSPVSELGFMPPDIRAALERTFERYWSFFQQRRDDPAYRWVDYTPYEVRQIGTFVLLGQKERAHALLDWFYADQHPAGWRHWAEIVHRDRSRPAWIGDMPHTWVGSDLLNAARNMFLWENEANGSLDLFRGVRAEWVADGQSLAFGPLATAHGPVTASLTGQSGNRVTIRLSGGVNLGSLPKGVVVHSPLWPERGAITAATLNGSPVVLSTGSAAVTVTSLPAELVLVHQSSTPPAGPAK